eukprot:1344964-Pleurochrysis_carterae.AAC.1
MQSPTYRLAGNRTGPKSGRVMKYQSPLSFLELLQKCSTFSQEFPARGYLRNIDPPTDSSAARG